LPEPDSSFDLPSRRPRSDPAPPPALAPPVLPPKPLLPLAKASRIAAWSASVPASSSSASGTESSAASSSSASGDVPLRSALKGARARTSSSAQLRAPPVVPEDDGLDGVVEPFDAFRPVTGKESAGQLYGTWVRKAVPLSASSPLSLAE